jgi:N-acetylglucosaminyldiphosphoundecaprenol N-acetyl-beta-D-mannosaminyltransferase
MGTPLSRFDPAASLPARRFVELDFAVFSLEGVLSDIRKRAHRAQFSYVVTPNTDHVVKLAKHDNSEFGSSLRKAYAAADMRVCDSRVLAKLARVSGVKLDVLPGSDLTRLIFERSVIAPGDRVAVVGGTAGQVDWLRATYPDISYCSHVPVMDVLHNLAAQDAIIEFVEQAKCHFNLFSFGAPQSELVAWRLAQRGQAHGVALCIGASLEFLSGAKRRAPLWMQKHSLEWAFRLATERRRLWRRYIVDGPRILPIWWRDRAERNAVNRSGANTDRRP